MTAQPNMVPHAPSVLDRARVGVGLHTRALLRAGDEWAILRVTVFGAAAGSILALRGGANALQFDDLQELVAAAGGAVALALASRRQVGPSSRLAMLLAISLAFVSGGMVAWNLAPAEESALTTVGDVLLAAAVISGVAAIVPATFTGLGRDVLAGIATDAVILFLAGTTVVAAIWARYPLDSGDSIACVGAVLLVSVTGACVHALVSRRITPALGGPWILFTGAVILGASWLIWIGDPNAPSEVGLSDFMFSAGVLLIACGGVTWETSPSYSPAFERVAPAVEVGLPVGAILGSLGITAMTHGPGLLDLVGVSTAAVIVISAGRQVHLYAREARAREAERRAGQRLAAEVGERASTLLSLQRLGPRPTLEETARQVCAEAVRLEGIELAIIRAYPHDGAVVPIAAEGLGPRAADLVGRPLPSDRAAHVRRRAAAGAWAWTPGNEPDSAYRALLRELGVRATVNAPLVWNGSVIGDIGLGTYSAESAASLGQRVSTAEEFSVVVAALLGPAMAERDRAAILRRTIERVIVERSFRPVFQPIVDLKSSRCVGYEALMRFGSGQRPDLAFADAWSVGLGADLELASLEAAVAEARRLPPGPWLSLNVSPGLLADPERVRAVLSSADRPLVLEITEHEVIEDYRALQEAFAALGKDVRLAVDDAGAGVANFGHIVELRPDFVKLDIGLVRHVDTDLGRQALVVGMRHFARKARCRIIAEGIETAGEARTLTTLSVEFGQGYFYGRPESVDVWEGAAGCDPRRAA